MNKKKLFNTIFFVLAVYAVYLKLPSIISHFKFQDQKAPDFKVKLLSNKEVDLNKLQRKVVLVFWATWCGPCEVELKRVNEMIQIKKLQPDDVLAISMGENIEVVQKTVKEKNYLFNVGTDADEKISHLYKVSATPTVIFIDEKQTINWMTAGISPTLEFRITSFFK